MSDEIIQKIEEQQKKIDAIYISVERLRKYFLWTLVITIVTIVLPLIGLIVLVPWMLHTLTTAYNLNF